MKYSLLKSIRFFLIISILLILQNSEVFAQHKQIVAADSLIAMPIDSVTMNKGKQQSQLKDKKRLSKKDSLYLTTDTTKISRKRDWATWRPNPQRALWLAIVIPGAGQIYNHKYWKLPIVYGGFIGCLYAMRWNNMMYKDYSQAYLDIMDNDPNTQSYNSFLHLGTTITSSNEDTYKNIFKRRKNYYRRYRDLSFFCLIGVYALSVIDAYVDAELSVFDISKDLSMKIRPTTINNQSSHNPLYSTSVGLQCSLDF